MTQATEPSREPAAPSQTTDTVHDMSRRMIDTWFPCPEVDAAVKTPTGSGLSEKALFTWFASRPIAQARAAVLCSMLPDTPELRSAVRSAVLTGDESVLGALRHEVVLANGGTAPVVLDMFSGRGIIPLEAARSGATAVGVDLSPVAALAGRLLADYPLHDWSQEPPLPFSAGANADDDDAASEAETSRVTEPTLEGFEELMAVEPRLLSDVRALLDEVARRVTREVGHLYPGNPDRKGERPWAYLWSVTIPCDGCRRRFPLIGSMVLRYPYTKTGDKGQALELITEGDEWKVRVLQGPPSQDPTFASVAGRAGKAARCPFPACGHVHGLEAIKGKGMAGQYRDSMLAVGETDPTTKQKVFRLPREDEVAAAASASPAEITPIGPFSAVPNEPIAEGNSNTLQARLYGYNTYGSLMNDRQAVLFAATARVIDDLYTELRDLVSEEYARALVSYVAANIPRQLRRATRGVHLNQHGKPNGSQQNRLDAGDVFSTQSIIKFQFDYVEPGCASGPGTWTSVSSSLVNALKKILQDNHWSVQPARLRRASAVALPFRDNSVDVVVTDPPYYDMITYADSSDLSYVWMKRALRRAAPELFDGRADDLTGVQDKAEEIIVKSKGRRVEGEHRTREFYETMLFRSFIEARRVLKADGHLTVIFGHSDPEAWKRLLAALTAAGFVVTSSWPSRTERAVTGVATISVTVSIGARVAPAGRPIGIAALVEAEVVEAVKSLCRGWDADGLALEDQLMASYGAALQVVGRYDRVITPDGAEVPLEHYMTMSRRAVRDAIALRLGEQPLETFDPFTRLAVFWHETYGRAEVPKGEARFFAQSDSLRLEDLRGPILEETKAGFRLRHDAPGRVNPASSAYEVVRAMAAAQPAGTDAVAAQLSGADRPPTDAHVWALVDWLATKLPSSDPVAVSLAAIKRNTGTIQKIAADQAKQAAEVHTAALFEETP